MDLSLFFESSLVLIVKYIDHATSVFSRHVRCWKTLNFFFQNFSYLDYNLTEP